MIQEASVEEDALRKIDVLGIKREQAVRFLMEPC